MFPRSVLRIMDYLQPAFVSLPLWKEKLAGGCDPGGNGSHWAKQRFLLEER